MGPLLKGLLRSLGGSEANFLELCFGWFPYGNFHTKATSKKFRPPSGNFRPNPPELPRSPSRSGSSEEAGRKIVLLEFEQERADLEWQAQQYGPVFPEAPQTHPYSTPPVVRWSAATQVAPAALDARLLCRLALPLATPHETCPWWNIMPGRILCADYGTVRAKMTPQPAPAREPSMGAPRTKKACSTSSHDGGSGSGRADGA